ncbi:FMN-binding protein (plasmid) [Nicoliella spurrieriana]|uniref:FMN-binding protein n=1 Tax=Nicoliella spurrieriana TaxID=2925830 RepID=A0A976RQU8_9LACO|nr:FMN-binding protein [Nicoliella spurrieriana]UQS86123.1 FMN-binding protein [Nicoliella spurrieriana]
MMKKLSVLLISIAVLLAVIIEGYTVFFDRKQQTVTTSPQSQTASQTSSSGSSDGNNKKQLKNGTYTGAATETRHGDVQVKMVVKNNKISNITVLKHPEGGKSDEINEQALPIYTKEALQKQSAKINQVSGATETYGGFTGSLQDAITKAES